MRKNRYVVLPIDFEEAWKVRCLLIFGAEPRRLFKSISFFSLLPLCSKLSSAATRLTNSVSCYPSPIWLCILNVISSDRWLLFGHLLSYVSSHVLRVDPWLINPLPLGFAYCILLDYYHIFFAYSTLNTGVTFLGLSEPKSSVHFGVSPTTPRRGAHSYEQDESFSSRSYFCLSFLLRSLVARGFCGRSGSHAGHIPSPVNRA